VGAYGEDLVARASKQHLVVADPPEQHAAVLKRADGNALPEVWAINAIGTSHVSLPMMVAATVRRLT
jgi:hypothetical protein